MRSLPNIVQSLYNTDTDPIYVSFYKIHTKIEPVHVISNNVTFGQV